MNPPEFFALVFLMGGGIWVLRPIATAIARRIAGEHVKAAMPSEESAELRAELDVVRRELGELAERLDFAERLLAQQRETPRIGGGGT